MAIPSIFQGFPQGNRMRALLGGDQGLDPGDFGGGDFQRPPPPMPRRNKYIEAAMQNGGQYPGTSPINADPEWMEYQQWFLSRQGGMGRGGGLLGTLANALGMGQQGAQQAGPAMGGMPRPVGNRPTTQGASPAPVQMPQDGTYQAPAPQPGPGTGMPPGLWKGANSGMTFADTVKLDAVKKKKEQLEKQIQSLDEKRNTLFQQAQSLEPPKPQQPMGYRDLLPMLGIGLVAKLLGATDRDLAEGGAGFLQGRGQWAQGQNDYQQQLFKAKQQGLMGQAEIADREFGYANEKLSNVQNRLDKLDDRAYTEGINAKNAGIMEGRDLINRWLQANTADEKALVGSKLVQRGEMTQPEVDAAVKAMRDDKRNANRDKIYRAVMPYLNDDAERTKLTNWFANMTDEQLELTAGRSEPERAQIALTALRGEQKRKTGLEADYLSKTMDERVLSVGLRNGLTKEQIRLAKIKADMYPEYLAAIAGSRELGDALRAFGGDSSDWENRVADWEANVGKDLAPLRASLQDAEKKIANGKLVLALPTVTVDEKAEGKVGATAEEKAAIKAVMAQAEAAAAKAKKDMDSIRAANPRPTPPKYGGPQGLIKPTGTKEDLHKLSGGGKIETVIINGKKVQVRVN